jgi:hypothetical protein
MNPTPYTIPYPIIALGIIALYFIVTLVWRRFIGDRPKAGHAHPWLENSDVGPSGWHEGGFGGDSGNSGGFGGFEGGGSGGGGAWGEW